MKTTYDRSLEVRWDSVERLVLVVRDDKWMFIHPIGAKESTCTIEKGVGDIQHIAIDRYDGKKQVGIMRVEGSRLVIRLSDPDVQDRPTKFLLAPDGQPFPGTYVFTRKVTKTGLMALQVNIYNDPSMKLLSEP